jgi:DNA polymerase I-like protein with 3'-5' exonuclease and polymerase domains
VKLYSLDIETVCNREGCVGFNEANDDKCSHALSPWHNRITVIGIVTTEGEEMVFRDFEKFRAWYKTLDTSTKFIGHNFKFDVLNLRARGIELTDENYYGDTMLMAYVSTDKVPNNYLAWYAAERTRINKTEKKRHRKAGRHNLKVLAPYFLGVEPFWETDDKDNDDYVLTDARYTLKLYTFFEARLKALEQWPFYVEKQLPWSYMMLAAEERGITIDMDSLYEKERELKAKALHLEEMLEGHWAEAHFRYKELMSTEIVKKYTRMANSALDRTANPSEAKINAVWTRYNKLMEEALKKVPTRINYGSPSQMTWLLRDFFGYDIQSLDGDESTGKEVLNKLANEGKEDVRAFVEWRETSKLLSSFIETYKDLQVDGVIHPTFNPANTRTGRTSSSNPNLQQVPPELRLLFKAREGYKFVSYDAAAIEARMIALYSDDPVLYDLIKNNISIHDLNTKVFFGLDCSFEEVSKLHKDKRVASKNVGFALFYNAAENRIRIAFAQRGFILTDAECSELLNRFRSTYRVAFEYSQVIVKYFKGGGTLENLFGRPIKIDDKRDAYMKGFNTLIQSTASDYNLDVAHKSWKNGKIEAHPLLFVHDSNTFEVPISQAEEFERLYINHATEYKLTTSHGPLALAVEGGIMERWEK